MKKFILFIFVILLISLSIFTNIELGRKKTFGKSPEVFLYLPSGKYLDFISVGYNSFFGDLLLAQALIYFGRHYYEQERQFSYPWLYHLFDVVTDMDSHNKEAFLMGGRLVAMVDVEKSAVLLQKGMKHHPNYWKFPHLIGYNYFYYLDDYYNAAKYYEIASKMPGHPPYVPSLSGKFYRDVGKFEEAIRVLKNFYKTTEDERLKRDFKEDIERIQELIDQTKDKIRVFVEKVYDGDTIGITLNGKEEKLRLIGVNSPEVYDEKEKVSLRGKIAREFTAFQLHNKNIYIKLGKEKRDSYGRLLAYVWLENLTFFNEFIIEQGYANAFTKYPFDIEYKKNFIDAEKKAKEEKRGLWGYEDVVTLKPQDSVFLLGRIVKMKYRCYKVSKRGQITYLDSDPSYRAKFQAVIFEDDLIHFTQDFLKSLEGKHIKIHGFLKFYKNIPEIRVFYPSQIEITQ